MDISVAIVLAGVAATVLGVAVLAVVPGRRRWPQLLVGTGVVLVLVGLLVRSSTPHPDPCATGDPHTCAVTSSDGP